MNPASLPSNVQLQILQLLNATSNRTPSAAAGPSSTVNAVSDALSDRVLNSLKSVPSNGYAVIDSFLPSNVSTRASSLLSKPSVKDSLRPAQIGTGSLKIRDETVRSDYIRFVHSKTGDSQDTDGEFQKVVDLISEELDKVIAGVNSAFGLHERDTKLRSNNTLQLGFYSNGAKYRKHRDSSAFMPGRLITLIIYFVQDWKESDGGHLRLHFPTSSGSSGGDIQQPSYKDISPLFNRLLVFKSHYEHEVLPTFCDRFALTMWLYSETPSTVAAICRQVGAPLQDEEEGNKDDNADEKSTIFVSIASYRDPDTNPTIQSLISTAKYPSRIKIGVLYQDHPTQDIDLHPFPLPDGPTQVISKTIDSRTACGPYTARREIAKSLHLQTKQGQPTADYFLQLDSHLRFTQDWDVNLLKLMKDAEGVHLKSVLSFYPPPFGDGDFDRVGGGGGNEFVAPPGPYNPILMQVLGGTDDDGATAIDKDGMIRVKGRLVFPPPAPAIFDGVMEPKSIVGQKFVAGGFLFGKSDVVYDLFGIPKDGEVTAEPATTGSNSKDFDLRGLFFGEEVLCTARIWTRGWKVWGPRDPEMSICFHRWDRTYRRTFWENMTNDRKLEVTGKEEEKEDSLALLKKRSQDCVKFVISGATDVHCKFQEWERGSLNGVGLERSVEEFLEFTGIPKV
ncbi:hypothetical protein BDR26DRAFT_858755, partial [Obelidium mucronatum]